MKVLSGFKWPEWTELEYSGLLSMRSVFQGARDEILIEREDRQRESTSTADHPQSIHKDLIKLL